MIIGTETINRAPIIHSVVRTQEVGRGMLELHIWDFYNLRENAVHHSDAMNAWNVF